MIQNYIDGGNMCLFITKQMETCGSCAQIKNCLTVGMIVKNNPDALKNLAE